MNLVVIVIIMVIVIALGVIYGFTISESSQAQKLKLGSHSMLKFYLNPNEFTINPGGSAPYHYDITLPGVSIEPTDENSDDSFDIVAIAEYTGSDEKSHLVMAGEASSMGMISPIENPTSYEVISTSDPRCVNSWPSCILIYAPCDTPVRATCSGRATATYQGDSHGVVRTTVEIRHDNQCKDASGNANYEGSISTYADLRDVDVAKLVDGKHVNRGEIIGKVNNDIHDNCFLSFSIQKKTGSQYPLVDPSFLYAKVPVIPYSSQESDTIDLDFEFYDNVREDKYMHVTFWVSGKCIEDYMSKADRNLEGLIGTCASSYLGSLDAIVNVP